jgi:hypothetical protein
MWRVLNRPQSIGGDPDRRSKERHERIHAETVITAALPDVLDELDRLRAQVADNQRLQFFHDLFRSMHANDREYVRRAIDDTKCAMSLDDQQAAGLIPYDPPLPRNR